MANSDVECALDKMESMKLTEAEEEEYCLDETVKIIVRASVRIKCSMLARAKALLLYHRFKRCVGDYPYDIYLIAGASLDLAVKSCEEVVNFDMLIFHLYDISGKSVETLLAASLEAGELEDGELPNEDGEKTDECELYMLRKSFLIMEILILRMIEFTLDDKLAYDYLTYFMNDLRQEFVSLGIWDVLSETVIKITSDFYLTNKCLNFQPDEIAVTVMEFALRMLTNDKQFEMKYRKKWLKCLSDVPRSTKMDIMEVIFKLGVVTPVAEDGKMKRQGKILTPVP